MRETKKIRNRIYRVCGMVIIFAMMLKASDAVWTHYHDIGFLWDTGTYCVESTMIFAFGISWIVKGETFLMLNDDNSKMKTEELYSAIASYLPDRQLITFSPEMMIVPRGNDGERGFANITQISYLFHEWMHYLHNISTLHGVSAFIALTELWNAFRNTTDSAGIGSGKIDHINPELFKVDALMEIFTAARKSITIPLPADTQPESVSVVSFVEKKELKYDSVTHLEISVLLKNEDGDQAPAKIILGPREILESVASLLEKRFLERLAGIQVAQLPVVPYHVLTIFSHFLTPSLTEEDILLCGLASLHSTYPVNELVKILKACESIESTSEKRREHLSKIVIRHLQVGEPQYIAWLDRLDLMFPNRQSMALAVNETVRYMRRNLEVRTQRPFFELDIIDEMQAEGAQGFHPLMDRLMATHGMCSGRQEHSGFQDELGRDILFDFTIVAGDPELIAARRVMLASFDFVLRHLSTDWSFVATDRARKGPCPFFTSCVAKTRIESPTVCATQPWQSVHSDTLCWYAEGVTNLKPGKPANIS